MTPARTTAEFHSATRAAQIWLAAGAPDHAERCLRIALRHANRISPAARKMILRVLCWVRQAMRKDNPSE